MKAIALISGGLDSTLAARLMQELGVELICLNTVSPFCLCNRPSSSGCMHGASKVAKDLNLRLISIDVSEEILNIVRKPRFGYGSNINPCIDCRILLLEKAREAMQSQGASFIITGEVLGQRPMSQRLHNLRLIEAQAGLSGLVVRPLSAKVLSPTIPEKEGWIPREKLLAINGRGRREQFDLARKFGINDFPCPSGGCLLTDPQFSKRLRDLMQYGKFGLNDIQLLKIGRHFRLDKETKLVVGRNQAENERLMSLAREDDYIFMPSEETAGPTALGRGIFGDELMKTSFDITSSYCDINGDSAIEVSCFNKGVLQEKRAIPILEKDRLTSLRI
jgi:tRNA U34 2-thiouridine synthase MnmA/TrmU